MNLVIEALRLLNQIRDEEYRFKWELSITGHNIHIWPASDDHTVWKDIALFASHVDEFAYPSIEETCEGKRIVYRANVMTI